MSLDKGKKLVVQSDEQRSRPIDQKIAKLQTDLSLIKWIFVFVAALTGVIFIRIMFG